MLHPQDNPEACAQLIRLFLINATRPDFTLNLLCDDLQSHPDKLWKFCQDAFGHPPSDLHDWARAKAFLNAIESEPTLKMWAMSKRLGFKSASSFNQFAHRAFGTTPQGVKRNTQVAKEKMRVRYKAIQECYEQMIQSSPRKSKPEQNQKRSKRVDEQEYRTRIPMPKLLGKKKRRK